MFQLLALRFAAAMVSVLGGLCLLVTVLALIVWAKGGENANGMPGLAIGFFVGLLVCVVVTLMFRRRSQRAEAAALDQVEESDGQA
ncbi:hypothetical protein [Calidifontibacter terrae]